MTSVPPPKPKKGFVSKENANTSRAHAKQKAEAAARSARAKLMHANRKVKALEAVQEALKGEETTVVTGGDLAQAPEVFQKYVAQKEVIFKPNPGPQTDFLAAPEKEVFFGGARGGGKSIALLVDPLQYCRNKNHRALIIRKTMPELRDMINKTHQFYTKAYPGAKWREQEKEWRFPSGARIEFGYCESDADVFRYLGQSYSWIGVDELPLFSSPDTWNFLRSSLRSADPDLPTYLRATGNPGCIGSRWVKELFIDPAPANQRFWVEVDIPGRNGEPGRKHKISRRFIPSSVYDNPYLTYDDGYVGMLASLPEIQRRQFLEGDWDAFDNAAFSEFRKSIHVLPKTFVIPESWPKFRAADWGYSSPACCLWFAVDHDGKLYVYRELYCNGEVPPRKFNGPEFARRVLDMEAGERIRYGVLDASVWNVRGDIGPSIAESMIKEGCQWRPSDRHKRSRENGKMEVHRRLSIDEFTKKPKLYILENCVNLIRTLPTLPLDENNIEDVDTDAEDHAYDALRYGVMSRPLNAAQLGWSRQSQVRYQPVDPIFGA